MRRRAIWLEAKIEIRCLTKTRLERNILHSATYSSLWPIKPTCHPHRVAKWFAFGKNLSGCCATPAAEMGPHLAQNAAPESSFFGCCCGLLACVLGRAYAHWLGAYHNASFHQVPVTPQGPRLFALETRRLVPGVRWSRALLPGFAPNWPLQGHRWSR